MGSLRSQRLNHRFRVWIVVTIVHLSISRHAGTGSLGDRSIFQALMVTYTIFGARYLILVKYIPKPYSNC